MKTNKTFSLRARGESFGFAFNGIKTFLQQEHNAILHAVATTTVVVLAILFPVSKLSN